MSVCSHLLGPPAFQAARTALPYPILRRPSSTSQCRAALRSADVSELPPKMQYPAGAIGYHPQAAAAAWEEVQRFLQPAK